MKIYSTIRKKVWEFDQIDQDGSRLLYEKKDILNYEFKSLGNNRYIFILNNQSYLVQITKENSIYHIHLDGDYFPVRVEDSQTRELRQFVEHTEQNKGEHSIYAPIPGLITNIKVKEGDKILSGDGLIILEAMKMENEIKSDSQGEIKKILVSKGMTVEKNQELIKIQ